MPKLPGPTKDYLGDGVYAEIDASRQLVLTTENGISVTNEIYLDKLTLNKLRAYLAIYENLIQ